MTIKILKNLFILSFLLLSSFAIGQTRWAGNIDGITYDNNRDVYYVFNGTEYNKHQWNRSAQEGYPRKIKGNWRGWPASWGDGNVDAIAYDSKRDVYYLFKGDEYLKQKWGVAGTVKKIKGNWSGWPDSWGTGNVSAVTYDEQRDVYYLFKGDKYVKHKWGGTYDRNVYPASIAGKWAGWSNGFNSNIFDAVTYDNSSRQVYYVFSNANKLYGKHKWNKPEEAGYPKQIMYNWKGYQADIGKYQYHMIIASDPQFYFAREEDKDKSKATKESQAKKYITQNINCMNQDIAKYNVKGVIINGDITRGGTENQVEVINGLLSKINAKVYPGLGNHDQPLGKNDPRPGNATRMFNWVNSKAVEAGITNNDIKTEGANKLYGSSAYSWNEGNMHFVQLQVKPGYTSNWSFGGTTYQWTNSYNWMVNDLAQADGRYKRSIINYHIPEYPGQNFVNQWKDKDVAAVFAGHTKRFDLTYNYPGKVVPIPLFESNAMFRGTYYLVSIHEKGMMVKKRYTDLDKLNKYGEEYIIPFY